MVKKRDRARNSRAIIQTEIVEVIEKLVTRGRITDRMLEWIDQMEKPEDKFRAAVQLLKFGAPQMANQTIQIEDKTEQGPTKIIVQAAEIKSLDAGDEDE